MEYFSGNFNLYLSLKQSNDLCDLKLPDLTSIGTIL